MTNERLTPFVGLEAAVRGLLISMRKRPPKPNKSLPESPRNIFQNLCRQISGKNNERKKHMKTIKKLTSAAFAAVILGMSTMTANAALCVSTAGYWASHPDAWCVPTIQLGCQTYTEAEAIAIMQHSTSGDKTYSLAAQLIAAKLNVYCAGANSSCVNSAISNADVWLCQHPVGSGITSNNPAWKQINSAYNTLTDYNEGRLCAPHCRS